MSVKYAVFYDKQTGIYPVPDIMTDEEYAFEKKQLEKEEYGSMAYEFRSYLQTENLDTRKNHVKNILTYYTYGSINPEILPYMIEYITSPTKKNARYLLMSMNIPIPLELLNRKWYEQNKKSWGSGPNEIWSSNISRRNFAICDFLHDLQKYNQMPVQTILNLSTLSTANKLLLQSSFTQKKINQTVKDIFFSQPWNKYELRTKQDAPLSETYILEKDRDLIQQWQSWLQKGKASIVLDGIIHVSISDQLDKSDILKGLLQCAFIHLLCSNAVKIHLKTGTYKVELHEKPKNTIILPTLELIDGFMNDMDRVCFYDFYTQWINAVKVDGRIGNVIIKTVSSVSLQHFHNPGVKIQSDRQQVTIPISGHTYLFPFTSTSFSIHQFKYRINASDRNQYIEDHYGIALPKRILANIMDHVADLSKETLEAIITANFLRDAVKAEVAIQENAGFITYDQLAFLYYLLQCRGRKYTPKGFWVNETTLFS